MWGGEYLIKRESKTFISAALKSLNMAHAETIKWRAYTYHPILVQSVLHASRPPHSSTYPLSRMVLLIHGRDVRFTFSTRRLSLAVLFVLLAAVFAFYWNLLPPRRHPCPSALLALLPLYWWGEGKRPVREGQRKPPANLNFNLNDACRITSKAPPWQGSHESLVALYYPVGPVTIHAERCGIVRITKAYRPSTIFLWNTTQS